MTEAPYTIRLAGLDDAEIVRGIVHHAYSPYVARIGKPPGPMLDDYAKRIADRQAWVLEDDTGIAGVLVLEETAGSFLLDNIAVAPATQGKGLGRRLIAFAEQQALARGYTRIDLYTHVMMTENIALYRRLGFRETKRVNEKGFDRVYMSKPLT
jgi:ribosomal protein S18 acetylase RimI-like enzyme